MGTKNIILLFVIFTFISICESQVNKCATKESCGACIRDSECVWCNAPFVENSKLRRCELYEKTQNSSWCADEFIINPKSSKRLVQNTPLQSTIDHDAVQITPQRVQLTLRPGEEYPLNFKYARAKDYPVDLYFIMDLSASMKVHKDTLSELGNSLSDTMRKLTKNFRLGFGSFVDKVAMPYTSSDPRLLKSPCKDFPCAPPYSFKNHLSLTEDNQKFTEEVRLAKVSGNLDFPEGGLDALMQAIVCHKDIGWRSDARRLIVLSTDADFHIAGDGKLGGIVLPNDGECHLENKTNYTHGNILDYPSIAQIRHKVIENNINVIFAIAKSNTSERVHNVYQQLKNRIDGSAVGLLTSDSSNVIKLVTGVYDKIVETVKISDNSGENIEVKYYSTCGGNEEKETNECNNLKVEVEVDFKAVIKVVNCPETRKQTFQIRPGALNEVLTVDVDMICDCECEKQGKKLADECHKFGTLKCGICNCDAGKFGTNCECDARNITITNDDSNCKINSTSAVCSGLGTCKCNTCDCKKRFNSDEHIYGKYCECTNYSCKRNGGALCSNNGMCDCGVCKCNAGFEGEACECQKSLDTCVAPNGKICNDHGNCTCGTCICDDSYYGQFCQECPSCEGQLCTELQDCVEYFAHKTGIYDSVENYNQNCSTYKNITKIIEIIDEEKHEREKVCRKADNQSCIFYFKYYYDYNNDQVSLRIFAEKEKICPTEVNILALVGGIIGSILLAGLILLLLWKGITTIHDRREYAKFENERKNAQWHRGENPLFKNPTTTFKNPTFSNENNS